MLEQPLWIIVKYWPDPEDADEIAKLLPRCLGGRDFDQVLVDYVHNFT